MVGVRSLILRLNGPCESLFGLTQAHLSECLREAESQGLSLDHVAISKGYLEEGRWLNRYAEQQGIRLLYNLDNPPIFEPFLRSVPIAFARRFRFIALADAEGKPILVTARPLAIDALDNVAKLLGQALTLAIAPEKEIMVLIDRHYEHRAEQVQQAVAKVDGPGFRLRRRG